MDPFVLEILDGDRAGDVVALGAGSLRIGRKPQNDLVIADEKASGVHAEVALEGDRHVLRDLGSTNGTLLDGRKVGEVVLTPGDTFAIGRVRIRYRSRDAAAVPADDGLQVARLDTSRLRATSSSRSVVLLLVLLLAAAGAGAWLWLQSTKTENTAAAGAARPQEPPTVPGNVLAANVAGCETEDGFDLRLHGAAFALDAAAHSGSGCLLAERGDGDGAPDHAVLTLAAPAPVLAGRTVTAVAFVQTSGGATATVRLWFGGGGSPEAPLLQFRTGERLQTADTWTRLVATAAVPAGADRARLEVVAVLPEAGAAVRVDDVALAEVTGAGLAATASKIEDAGATVLATGQSVVVRASGTDAVALAGLAPGTPDASLRGLLDAGLLCLSDVGAEAKTTVDARGCDLAATGVDRLVLQFPAEQASGMLLLGEDGFAPAPAGQELSARAVLLGEGTTRCLVELPVAATMQVQRRGGRFDLVLPGASCRLVMGFRTELGQARDLLRESRGLVDSGQPGKALDLLRTLQQRWPHASEPLAQAQAMRATLQQEIGSKLAAIARDLENASFFQTRGGFERVVASIDTLQERYGTNNFEDPDAVAALRSEASQKLAAIEAERKAEVRQRLETMATAFAQAEQPALAKLVRDYLERHVK